MKFITARDTFHAAFMPSFVLIKIATSVSLRWNCYFKPLTKLWAEGAQSLVAYHRSQRSTKSDTAAFQDFTAKKMSRFVTLCALTRLHCLTPKSALSASTGVWHETRCLLLTAQTLEVILKPAGTQDVSTWVLTGQRLRDKQPAKVVRRVRQQCPLPLASFWGLHYENELSVQTAGPAPKSPPAVYGFVNMSGWYKKVPPQLQLVNVKLFNYLNFNFWL